MCLSNTCRRKEKYATEKDMSQLTQSLEWSEPFLWKCNLVCFVRVFNVDKPFNKDIKTF